jgi:diaminopimelate decarboxylase
MEDVFVLFSKKLQAFKEKTGREIKLEIEPGTYFVAHAGTLVASIDDIVNTGTDGYAFLKLNTGMNDFLRSALYGAQHKIEVINDSSTTKAYIVVGHNCESGDIFTPVKGNPEEIEPRTLNEAAIGDEIRIYDVGAYCEAMSTKGYNSFPDAERLMVA